MSALDPMAQLEATARSVKVARSSSAADEPAKELDTKANAECEFSFFDTFQKHREQRVCSSIMPNRPPSESPVPVAAVSYDSGGSRSSTCHGAPDVVAARRCADGGSDGRSDRPGTGLGSRDSQLDPLSRMLVRQNQQVGVWPLERSVQRALSRASPSCPGQLSRRL